MKKVIFFDVDGTLVDHIKGINEIPIGVIEQFKRLKEKGYYLFMASGRPKNFIPQELFKADFDGFILCNGAHVELRGENIYEKPLDYSGLKEVVAFLKKEGWEYDLEGAETCYLKEEFQEMYSYFSLFDLNDNLFEKDYDEDEILKKTLKIELFTPDNNISKLTTMIDNRFSFDNHGTMNACEIYSKDISKATGVNKVLEYLNISLADSYAFGDGINDIEMLTAVGHGVAMGNACDELKEVADEVCGHILENGLEEYLRRL